MDINSVFPNIQNVFTDIYNNNKWVSKESISGEGSTLLFTENIRKKLVDIIKKKSIKTMIDTSCGDWNWMRLIKDQLCDYTGFDIVKAIISKNTELYENDKTRFIHSDFLSKIKLMGDKSVDLILCRHTLEHLPTSYNISFIQECKRVCKYLLITTYNKPIENKELEISSLPYRCIRLEALPYGGLLNNHFEDSFYDGPNDVKREEMFINLYSFF